VLSAGSNDRYLSQARVAGTYVLLLPCSNVGRSLPAIQFQFAVSVCRKRDFAEAIDTQSPQYVLGHLPAPMRLFNRRNSLSMILKMKQRTNLPIIVLSWGPHAFSS
jgi:hypothetical protein